MKRARRASASLLKEAREQAPAHAPTDAYPLALLAEWAPDKGAYPARFLAMLSPAGRDLDANKLLAALGQAAKGVEPPAGGGDLPKVYVRWENEHLSFHWDPSLSAASQIERSRP